MIYILSSKKVANTKNLPVIKTLFLKEEVNLENFDNIIFTSKNGVLAIDYLNQEWRKIPSFAVGEATANKIKELKGNLTYIANSSYGDTLAKEITSKLKEKRVLYVRAKRVASNLTQILRENRVDVNEKILYETKCNDCRALIAPEKNSFIIFSSPSTIECFFECFEWDSSYRAITIGKTTAKFMPKGIEFYISPIQTLQGCIDFITSLR